MDALSKKLKVYDAFLREADGGNDGPPAQAAEGSDMTDLERITRLRRLEMHGMGAGVDDAVSGGAGGCASTSHTAAAAKGLKEETGRPQRGGKKALCAKQAWDSGSHSRPNPEYPLAQSLAADTKYDCW